MTAHDQLARVAAETAMRGAASWFRSHKIDVEDYGLAVELVRRHCKAGLQEAIEDAKAAVDAHMGEVAEMTFAASMRLAGFAAAKEYAEATGQGVEDD